MVRLTVAGAVLALGFSAGAATADVINVYDHAGKPVALDTSAVTGCQLIFDKAGEAFEICKMQKVEIRPPKSNRARPGQTAEATQSDVVYTRAKN
ncbi:MAG: hypothetical protein AAF360_06885 [Pseudomonadota bacterium]